MIGARPNLAICGRRVANCKHFPWWQIDANSTVAPRPSLHTRGPPCLEAPRGSRRESCNTAHPGAREVRSERKSEDGRSGFSCVCVCVQDGGGGHGGASGTSAQVAPTLRCETQAAASPGTCDRPLRRTQGRWAVPDANHPPRPHEKGPRERTPVPATDGAWSAGHPHASQASEKQWQRQGTACAGQAPHASRGGDAGHA